MIRILSTCSSISSSFSYFGMRKNVTCRILSYQRLRKILSSHSIPHLLMCTFLLFTENKSKAYSRPCYIPIIARLVKPRSYVRHHHAIYDSQPSRIHEILFHHITFTVAVHIQTFPEILACEKSSYPRFVLCGK